MNLQATADALFKLHEDMKTVKRNKSGSINEASRFTRYKACRTALMAAGWEKLEASDMTWGVLRTIN